MFCRIYQYSDGSYLPDSSQPDIDCGYKILGKKYIPHISTRYINIGAENKLSSMQDNKSVANAMRGGALPELYSSREECCGCSACFAVCPCNAISMLPDEEGFIFPVVDAAKCIRCHKCISSCAFKLTRMDKT